MSTGKTVTLRFGADDLKKQVAELGEFVKNGGELSWRSFRLKADDYCGFRAWCTDCGARFLFTANDIFIRQDEAQAFLSRHLECGKGAEA